MWINKKHMLPLICSGGYGYLLVLSGDSDGKESSWSMGDLGLIPGLGRSPGEGNGNPLQYSCPGKSHGQQSLVGYTPRGHRESDMTE